MTTAASIGLSPSEFWALSLTEFSAVCEGNKIAKKHEMHSLAWSTANLMNCWVKKKITVNKLLGNQDQKTLESGSDIRDKMRKRKEQREQKEFWGD